MFICSPCTSLGAQETITGRCSSPGSHYKGADPAQEAITGRCSSPRNHYKGVVPAQGPNCMQHDLHPTRIFVSEATEFRIYVCSVQSPRVPTTLIAPAAPGFPLTQAARTMRSIPHGSHSLHFAAHLRRSLTALALATAVTLARKTLNTAQTARCMS